MIEDNMGGVYKNQRNITGTDRFLIYFSIKRELVMKKIIKKMSKILAVFLSILFIVEILPTQVMAEAYSAYSNEKQFVSDLINNPADVAETEKAAVLCEVIEKRDANTKVFKRTDGSYTAVVSERPLHFFENGEWKDIDNTIQNKNGVLSNVSNSFTVEFPQELSESNEVNIENNGSDFSFRINDILTNTAKIENDTAKETTNIPEADAEISNNQSRITYTDEANKTDVQYIVAPNAVKENIIVSDAASVKDSYTFDISIGSMKYVFESDGSISFNENEETKFSIPAPVMIDSKLEFSSAIDVSVVDHNNGTITLVYKPSKEWINDPDRVFPINIDPVILLDNNDLSWVEDTWVSYDSSNASVANNTGYTEALGVVVNSSDFKGEIFTKINTNAFSILGEGLVITNATYITPGVTTATGNLYLKEVSESCNLQTVTYNTKPALSNNIIDYYTSNYDENNPPEDFVAFHFDITEAFSRWLNGGTNYGFATIADNSFGAIVGLNGTMTIFNSTTTMSTTLVLDYVYSNGYNNNFSYHSQSTSRAGTGYVNDFTRTLSVVRDDIELSGNIMPVSISSVYNTAFTELYTGLYGENVNPYGVGWQNSFQRGLVKIAEGVCSYFTETGTMLNLISCFLRYVCVKDLISIVQIDLRFAYVIKYA